MHCEHLSEPSTGMLEKLQCRSNCPNIKYNYGVLFLRQIYSLFIHTSKYFLIAHQNVNQKLLILLHLSKFAILNSNQDFVFTTEEDSLKHIFHYCV